MKTRPIFVLTLTASLAIHAAVLLLVRLDAPLDLPPPERVRISLRRVVVPPAPTPPPSTEALPAEPPREPPKPVARAETPPLLQEQAVEKPPEQPHTAPPPAATDDTLTAQVQSPAAARLPALEERPAPQPTETDAEQQQRILSELRKLILERIIYPPLARRRGLEGRVVLRLTLDTDGGADSLTVSQSSGHSVLDRAALELVARLLPLERGPSRPLTLEIPITYRLTR